MIGRTSSSEGLATFFLESQSADFSVIGHEGWAGGLFVSVFDAATGEVMQKFTLRNTSEPQPTRIELTLRRLKVEMRGWFFHGHGGGTLPYHMKFGQFTDTDGKSGYKLECGDFGHDNHYRNLVVSIIVETFVLPGADG